MIGSRYVLDSFAVLAYFQRETSGPQVEAMLRQASSGETDLVMSAINVAEVLYQLERRRGEDSVQSATTILTQLPIRIVDANIHAARGAAHLKARHRISLADGFAAALAQEMDAAVVTGDPEFQALEGQIRVHWLPR